MRPRRLQTTGAPVRIRRANDLKKFALRPKPPDYSEDRFFQELLRLPEAFEWTRAEAIVLQLCPVAMRLARQINWPLLRQCWHTAWSVSYLCEVRLEPRRCP